MQNSDLSTIFENIRPRAKQAGMDGTKDSLYNFFVQVRLLTDVPDCASCWAIDSGNTDVPAKKLNLDI